MENFASKEATLESLEGLGFVQLPGEPEDTVIFLDSPKKDGFGLPVVQISIYQCSNQYWCVDVEGGYKAPSVWYGPRAQWDKSDTLTDFVAWLDRNYPGWR